MSSVTSVTVKKPKNRTVNTVCKNCGTDVMHWIHYAAAGDIPYYLPPIDPVFPSFAINKRIFVHNGPAEELNCDVIAISATLNLAPKGLISIHKTAGKELTEAAKEKGPKRVTELAETGGFGLYCKSVFHVVTPAEVQSKDSLEKLEMCYRNVMDTAVNNGYKSIGLPSLTAGTVSGPIIEAAANVALRTVRKWLEENENHRKVESIILARKTDKDMETCDKFLHIWFPTEIVKADETVVKEESDA